MPVVAIVGTFDVENFGDVLFPEIAAWELGRRFGPVELRRYSYRPMHAPPWPYPVRAIEQLGAELDELDLLIVGGGHVVRFDRQVAVGYGPTTSRVHHPTGYWLVPTLQAAAHGVPVAWNAVGASPHTPDWARPLLAAAIEASDHVAVRDPGSLAELRRVAPTADIVLAADTAFAIGELLAERPAAGDGSAATDHRPDGPYVIVQPSPRLRSAARAIAGATRAAREHGLIVVELPISPILGDRAGILDLGPDVVRIDPWPGPVEVARLVAGSSGVVAHSLHLSIVAVALGVPVFRARIAAGTKYEPLGIHGHVRVFDGQGDELASQLTRSRAGAPGPEIAGILDRLDRHWTRIVSLIDDRAPRRPMHRRERIVSRLIGDLPGLLEGAAAAVTVDDRVPASHVRRPGPMHASARSRPLARLRALVRAVTRRPSRAGRRDRTK